jgi:hypothetical protein
MDWSTVVPLITAGVSTAGQIAAQRNAAQQGGVAVPAGGGGDGANWAALATAGIQAAGQLAANRQAGRERQAVLQGPVDRLNQDAATSTLGIKQRALDAQDAARLARAMGILQESREGRQAAGQRASNSVRGDILANAQDARFSGNSRIPQFSFSGGLRPSMFSGNTRQLGAEMSREALLDQLKGNPTPFSSLPEADYSRILDAKPIPGATPLPEGSRMDAILQAIGQYGGLAAAGMGAYQQAAKPQQPMVQPPPSGYTGGPVMGGRHGY